MRLSPLSWSIRLPLHIIFQILFRHTLFSHTPPIIDALGPTKTRIITVRPEAEWYNESIREAKQTRRQAERLWRKTGLVVHREVYMEARVMVNALIDQEKRNHYQSIIAENHGNTKQLFSVVHLLLGNLRLRLCHPISLHLNCAVCSAISLLRRSAKSGIPFLQNQTMITLKCPNARLLWPSSKL